MPHDGDEIEGAAARTHCSNHGPAPAAELLFPTGGRQHGGGGDHGSYDGRGGEGRKEQVPAGEEDGRGGRRRRLGRRRLGRLGRRRRWIGSRRRIGSRLGK